ncbi:MAG: DUF3604 domain-containing protein [Clostridia bacterium]|nr:DUF3604 domain-containing protein [Clostridia bacterium]
MNHPDKRKAKSIDTPGRCRAFTDTVYEGAGDPAGKWARIRAAENGFRPAPPTLKAFVGEMHGHTNLSDGQPDIDSYFRNLRDNARLDFGAVSDHDHGGVGRPCLREGSPSKWDLIREKVKEYDEPGRFTAILAYERDSYPFYNNMVIYYGTHDGEMIRGVRDGEITEDELRGVLARGDLFVVPHDTYSLSSGADLSTIPLDLLPPFLEIYSRGDACEYWDNPAFDYTEMCAGGFWQDALRRGAHMGVIAGSDDHGCRNGLITDDAYPRKFPGLTGVWAEENTLPSLFSALKAKRCYAFMGGRMEIDFRVNGHWMGETFTLAPDEDRVIRFSVKADAPVASVTVVKNCRDYARFRRTSEKLFFDYKVEGPEDHYYLRVELEDGRFGWTSPVWIRTAGDN